MYNHQLDTFLRVAELGSFGKAAETLFISAPAVIQQVNLLEQRCGCRLFVRTNHGVTLTPAGRSLAEDAAAIIRMSQDSLERVRRLAEEGERTVRVGTSLLFKCRLLPELWATVSADLPELKIEITSIDRFRDLMFESLGREFDIFEAVYADKSWDGQYGFLELRRTPVCCAVSRKHRLANAESLELSELNGECVIMPIAGISTVLDELRETLMKDYPTVQIIDSPYYGVDTFSLCEMNDYVLISQPVYSDIHTNLVTIPLNAGLSLPYGLIYSATPSTATQKFIKQAEAFRLNTSAVPDGRFV